MTTQEFFDKYNNKGIDHVGLLMVGYANGNNYQFSQVRTKGSSFRRRGFSPSNQKILSFSLWGASVCPSREQQAVCTQISHSCSFWAGSRSHQSQHLRQPQTKFATSDYSGEFKESKKTQQQDGLYGSSSTSKWQIYSSDKGQLQENSPRYVQNNSGSLQGQISSRGEIL